MNACPAFKITRLTLLALAAGIATVSAVLAGPVGPGGGGLAPQDVILATPTAQSKTFSVSSGTVSAFTASTATVKTLKFQDGTTLTTRPTQGVTVYPATNTVTATFGIAGSTLAFSSETLTGTLSVGTVNPSATAVFDASSTSKGILVPRLSTTQRDAISNPARGLLIFNATAGTFQFYSGSAWTTLAAGAVSIGSPANGLDIASNVLTIDPADGTHDGALTSDDWNTFNDKLSPDGNGSSLSGLTKAQVGLSAVQNVNQQNASNLTSGTVGAARLGSGTTDATTYLRGDGAWTTLNSTAAGLSNVTNDRQVKKADFNQKGALLVGTGSSAYSAFAPGTDGYFLSADSTAGTGTRWVVSPTVFTIYPATNTAYFNVGFRASTGVISGLLSGSTIQFVSGVFSSSITASNVSGTNTGDVTIGTANGLTQSGQMLSMSTSSANQPGALSAADWSSFNNRSSVYPATNTASVPYGISGTTGSFSGTFAAGTFSGSGASLTNVANSALDSSSVTKQGNSFNAGSDLLQLSGGLVPNANVDASSVTKQGNTFNAASSLVQLNGSSQLPAVSGANLTNLPAASVTGTLSIASGTIASLSATTLSASTVTALEAGAFAIGPVTGTAGVPSSGGSLTTGTSYYYKVFPMTAGGRAGIPSPEITVYVSGSNLSASLSWTATANAAAYRITRGTGQGSQSGYYQITSSNTAYIDKAFTFTAAGNAASQSSAQWMVVGGNIAMPASTGGLYFYDYATGQITGLFGQTSASEFEFRTGSNGASGSSTYVFEDGSGNEIVSMDRQGTDAEIVGWNSSGSVGLLRLTYGNVLSLAPGNVVNYQFCLSSAVFAQPLTLPDGSSSVAGWRFTSENTGFDLAAAGTPSLLVAGTQRYNWNATAFTPAGDNTQNLGSGSAHFATVFAGTTFNNNATSNQIVLGTTTVTINAPAGAAARTISIPTAGANDTFDLLAATQSVTALKTMAGGLAMAATKITGLSNGTSSTDAAAFGQVHVMQAPVFAAVSGSSSTTSSTFVHTQLTASITPTSASSKILVFALGSMDSALSNKSGLATIARGATNVAGGTSALGQVYAASGGEVATSVCMFYVDSPATTSATTYTADIRNTDGSTTIAWGGGSDIQTIVLIEVQ